MKKLMKLWRKNAPEVYGSFTLAALFVGEPYLALMTLILATGTMIRRGEEWKS